jgi:hypothetical protein
MKQILLLLPFVLASCASLAPPTDQEMEARALAAIGTFVDPLPASLSIEPDYVDERVTLQRGITVKTPVNGPKSTVENDDVPIGISLGNGLYLDGQNNLSIRVDLLAGVGSDFQGSTNYWPSRPGSSFNIQTQYQADSITGMDNVSLLGGKFAVDPQSEGQVVRGSWLGHKDNGYQLLSLTPSSWTKTVSGKIRKSWTEGLEFSTAGPRTLDFTTRLGRVFDERNNLVVERNESYLSISYRFGPEAQFRLYRSDTGIAVVNEANGAMTVFHKTDAGWDWQQVDRGAAPTQFNAHGRIVVRPAS